MSDDPHASLRERIIGEHGVVMLLGAADTGKTTLGRRLVADALAAGRSAAFVDGDVAAATVGPPACVGLRIIREPSDLASLDQADELRFVGSVQPQGVVLPHVVAVGALVEQAQREADFVVLDTTSAIGGVVGQTLKYHLMELCRPALVVAIQRGAEMDPTVAMLKRFLGARVARTAPAPGHDPLDPVERSEQRRKWFSEALPAPLDRWRVHSSVFAPTLPEGFEEERLDGMVVGIQNGSGHCLGLGVLEHDGETLRVATRRGDDMTGLRLGSMRIDLDTYATTPIRLRQLFFGI